MKTLTKTKQTPTKTKRQKKTPHERLLDATDQATRWVADGPGAISRRAKGAYRADVPRSEVERCLKAVEAALADARANVERIYSGQTGRKVVSRVRGA